MPTDPNIILAKLASKSEAATAKTATGKTFTVSKVTTAATGTSNAVVLTPAGGGAKAGTAASPLTLKLDSLGQANGLKTLKGKTVLVGKAPTTGGDWLLLKTHTATGAKAAAGSGLSVGMLNGPTDAANAKTIIGKTYTVVDPATVNSALPNTLTLKPTGTMALANGGAAKNGAVNIHMANNQLAGFKGLYGKRVIVDMPFIANKGGTGNWLALKAAPVATKGGSMVQVGMLSGTCAAKSSAGSGWGLGLGLGLSALGSAILGTAVLISGYAYYRYREKMKKHTVAS
jgi:hypothetical protein